jgi:tetratricopeptide (TPR) repeat protein
MAHARVHRISASAKIVSAGIVEVFIVVVLCTQTSAGSFLYESAMLTMFPSAQRAYSYGEHHFSSKSGNAYDVNKAQYFFEIAARENPEDPYAYHELARIAFLRSDYGNARSLITKAIDVANGNPIPSSYYVKGLIEGFSLDYDAAIADYKKYITYDPTNWAATNDLAWVLLKAHRPKEAIQAIDKVLPYWPENPWLLNNKATALQEVGKIADALVAIRSADAAVGNISQQDWLKAYPGNDPRVAREGVEALKTSIAENMHTIELASQKNTVQ